MKGVLRLLLIGLVLLSGGAFLAYRKLNVIVKAAVETLGPRVTGTEVKLASVSLSPLTGRGRLKGLIIGNPPGFKAPHAFKLGSIKVHVDLLSLPTDVLVLRDVQVEDPEIWYENGNLARIQKNVAEASPAPAKGAAKSKPRKIVIERFRVTGAKLRAASATLPVPDLELHDIGRDTGGVTVAEAGRRMMGAMVARSLDIGAQIGTALRSGAHSLIQGVFGRKK